MKKTTLFLFSLFLTIGAMAQDFLVKNKVTEVNTGYYVVVGTFNPNNGTDTSTGPAYYDNLLGDCKYRLDVDKTIAAGESLPDVNYVWYVENNGTTITLKNAQDKVFFVRDNNKNENFKGSATANLTLEVSQDASKFFMHLADYPGVGYIHCNTPGGDPCLSYWNSHAESQSTAVRFEFFEVEVDEQALIEQQAKISDFYSVETTFGTHSGPVTNIVNGNKNDKWWSNGGQEVGKTVDVILNNVHQVDVIKWYFCDGDKPLGATLERRAVTGGEWINVADFTIDDIEDNIFTCTAGGADVKELRLRITTEHSNWLQIAEVELWDYIVETDKTELQALIAEAETLLTKVADYSTEEGDGISISGKITSNAAQNNADGNSGGKDDGKGIAGLTDDDVTTYFHSRWGGTAVNEDHYLQIDLGEGNTLSDFCFSYSVRKGNSETETSPAPTAIEVRVSESGSDFGDPVATFPKDGNNLPLYTDLGATLWHSGVISAGKDIRYIRLTVTESAGPGNTQWEGHKFFAMSALNLYKTKQVPVVKDAYKGVITDDQMNMVAEALADANTVNNNNVASSAQVNTAASELDVALEPLRTAAKRYTLSVSAAGWASLYLDFPAEIPDFGNEDEEAGVYIVTGVKEGNWMNLVKVTDDVLPANTGVIVKAAQGTYEFKYSAEDAADVSANILKGTVKDEYIEGKAYVLGNKNGIGFYQAELNKNATGNDGTTHFKNNAYKSYLLATDIPATLSRSAGFRFSFGGTTVIEEVEVENEKVNEAIYDLAGRRLNEITKPGIYIINGKKVLVK